jgi:dUTP pyrophosphatase
MTLQYAIVEGYHIESPARGTEHSAGLDVFVPYQTPQFTQDFMAKNPDATLLNGYFEISPGERVVIPAGLKFNIPIGTYLEVANRGSVAAKKGLIFGAHIIDEDYVGNVFINLINTSNKNVRVQMGEKIAQLIHKQYIKSTLVQIPESDIRDTARGEGALGSTNKEKQ